MDGRTPRMCENNDHLFGRGLVGQFCPSASSKKSSPLAPPSDATDNPPGLNRIGGHYVKCLVSVRRMSAKSAKTLGLVGKKKSLDFIFCTRKSVCDLQ